MMNLKRLSREEIFYFSISVVSFALPFDQKLSNSIIGLCAACWLLAIPQLDIKSKWKQHKVPLLLFSSLYFINFIGLIHTDNMTVASTRLESRLIFLVFPVLIFLSNAGKRELRRAGYSFCFGVLASSVICFILNFIQYFQLEPDPLSFEERFTYEPLLSPLLIHPNYYAIFVSFCMLFLIHEIIYQEYSKSKKLLLSLFIVYLLFLNFLVQSRAPLTAFLVICLLGTAYWIIVYGRIHKMVMIIITIFFIGGLALFLTNKKLQGRFIISTDAIHELMFKPDSELFTSHQTMSTIYHLRSWHCCILLLSDYHFFVGHGTGDEKDALVSCYESYRWSDMVNSRLSAHNEYLSSFMRNGLFEFLLLVGVLVVPFFMSLRADQLLYAAFLLLWILVLFFCSANRQSALSFYSLFNALLYKIMAERERLSGTKTASLS